MKKLILLSVLAFAVASCGYEMRIVKKPEPPKPKLTKEQIRKKEYEIANSIQKNIEKIENELKDYEA